MRKIGNPGELEFLSAIRGRTRGMRSSGLSLGIGDDCALLRPRSGEEIAVTTDLSIDGRHFRLDWHTPESVGHRVLARGLSDIASMGARPLAAFLSLGLPPALTLRRKGKSESKSWADRFYDGLLTLAAQHNTPLAGGDLAESPVALADIVLVGAVPRNRALLRSGARPGHALYVTGTLGGAAAGLQALSRMSSTLRARITATNCPPQLAAHLFPQPRLAQAAWLQRHKSAAAAIDISDGLSTDLMHLCEESNVAAEIDATALPIAPGATLAQALHGGEDYELLFTAPASARLPRRIAGVPITRIGRMVKASAANPQITLLTDAGSEPLQPKGWQHFA